LATSKSDYYEIVILRVRVLMRLGIKWSMTMVTGTGRARRRGRRGI
jgi:hypothetical protein